MTSGSDHIKTFIQFKSKRSHPKEKYEQGEADSTPKYGQWPMDLYWSRRIPPQREIWSGATDPTQEKN